MVCSMISSISLLLSFGSPGSSSLNRYSRAGTSRMVMSVVIQHDDECIRSSDSDAELLAVDGPAGVL